VTEKQKPATSTDAVHAGIAKPRPHHTLTPSIAQTATFTFDDTADLERYMRGEDKDPEREEYGRYGNPTVHELEQRVAALDGAEDGVAFASGMAAVSNTLFSLTKAGDHVILFNDCYRRTRQLVSKIIGRFGVESTLIPPGDTEALEKAIRPNTRVIIAESPTNPLLYCTDLEALVATAKKHGRIRTFVDSTFATPINSRPLEFGVDLVVHSATKYLAGHNDVLGGVVTGPAHLISLIRDTRGVLGAVLDPHAAFLIGRGLKTLGVRVERQNTTALTLARALSKHPKVERVWYPGLESHSTHAVARKQMSGFGGVITFQVKGGRSAASRVVDASRVGTIATSLGGVETLIEQPAIMNYSELSPEELAAIGIDQAMIRLSVGIEATEDVVADLMAALEKA
jgi:cystathionine gamma-synthase